MRQRRAALLVKAVQCGKEPEKLQKYFAAALAAHEIDTLNLLNKDQV